MAREHEYYDVEYDPSGDFSGKLTRTSVKYTLVWGHFAPGMILSDKHGKYKVVDARDGLRVRNCVARQELVDV